MSDRDFNIDSLCEAHHRTDTGDCVTESLDYVDLEGIRLRFGWISV